MNRVAVRAAVIGFGAAAVLALGACSDPEEPTRDDSGEITEANENADVFALKVGDCLAQSDELNEADEVSSVPVVPCTEEHDGQVYAAVEAPEGDFPGTTELQTDAEEFCVPEFETFVGVTYEESVLDYYPFYPTTASWDQGDREIQCVVFDPEGPVTGALENAGR